MSIINCKHSLSIIKNCLNYFLFYQNISRPMAGVEGLEPSAHGFGDHCSTN